MEKKIITPDLKQIFELGTLKGKTVDRFVNDDQGNLLVFFTDKTVCVFIYDRDDEGDRKIEISHQSYYFGANDIMFENPYKIGIITKEEYEEFKSIREKHNADFIEHREREELKRLMAKYPDGKKEFVKSQIKEHLHKAANSFSGNSEIDTTIRNKILKTPISFNTLNN